MKHVDTRITRQVSPLLAMALTLLVAGAARAQGMPINELTVGETSLMYRATKGSTALHHTLDMAYHHVMGLGSPSMGLRLTLGMRVGLPGSAEMPLEGYSRLEWMMRMGPWLPAIGPEVGVSGFTRALQVVDNPSSPVGYPGELQDQMGQAYAGLAVAPLRFLVGRFTLSAAELEAGVPLNNPSSALRLQVGLIHIGGAL
jgi:hypothetical protein